MTRSADWSQWSPQQLAALLHLDFAMPVHEGYLRHRLNVRGSTITALINHGAARREYYREREGASGVPFITLTQAGRAVRRDWIRWNRAVRDRLGFLPPAMAAVAEARL